MATASKVQLRKGQCDPADKVTQVHTRVAFEVKGTIRKHWKPLIYGLFTRQTCHGIYGALTIPNPTSCKCCTAHISFVQLSPKYQYLNRNRFSQIFQILICFVISVLVFNILHFPQNSITQSFSSVTAVNISLAQFEK